MKRPLRFFLLFLMLFVGISCQKTPEPCNYITDYYPLVNKAQIAYESDDIDQAYKLYKQAFDQCTPRNTISHYEINNMARVCARKGLTDETITMIEWQIKNGSKLLRYKDDILYEAVFETKAGKVFLARYDALRATYLKEFDTELAEQLAKMSYEDQLYRFGRDYDIHRAKQDSIDLVNEKYLIKMFEADKYPSAEFSWYKDSVRTSVDIMLVHAADSLKENYFLPKLKKFIAQGKCDPKVYGFVYDRLMLNRDQLQAYGTYSKSRIDDSLYDHIPLDQVDKNRLAIGLPSLADKELLRQLKSVSQ